MLTVLLEQQSEKQLDAAAVEEDANSREFQFDEQRSKKLNRRLDIRLLPLLCWVCHHISALVGSVTNLGRCTCSTSWIEVILATPGI